MADYPNLLLNDAPEITQVAYTATELLKIRISGALLVIAVLVITYIAYTWYRNRAENWERRKIVEGFIRDHIKYNPEDYRPQPFKVNKVLLYLFGALVVAAGLVMIFLV